MILCLISKELQRCISDGTLSLVCGLNKFTFNCVHRFWHWFCFYKWHMLIVFDKWWDLLTVFPVLPLIDKAVVNFVFRCSVATIVFATVTFRPHKADRWWKFCPAWFISTLLGSVHCQALAANSEIWCIKPGLLKCWQTKSRIPHMCTKPVLL